MQQGVLIMKIQIIGFQSFLKKQQLQKQSSNLFTSTLLAEYSTKKQDIFVYSPNFGNCENENEIHYQKVKRAIINTSKIQKDTLKEIQKRIDEINSVSLEIPKEEEEYKNGKLFKTNDFDYPNIFEQIQYDEEGKKKIKILAHNGNLGDILNIITYNKDGKERAMTCYKDGELHHFSIKPEANDAGYIFIADNLKDNMGKNKILKTLSDNNSIEYGRSARNFKKDNYTYSRLQRTISDDNLEGSIYVLKEANEIYWLDRNNENKNDRDLTFKINEIKEFNADKIFEEVNSLTRSILPSEKRKEEINNFVEGLKNSSL